MHSVMVSHLNAVVFGLGMTEENTTKDHKDLFTIYEKCMALFFYLHIVYTVSKKCANFGKLQFRQAWINFDNFC